MTMLFDEMLELLGDFGPYQRRTFFLVWLMAIPTTWHVLLQVFTAGKADHWCYATEADNINCSHWNLTIPECNDAIKAATIPEDKRPRANAEYESCERYNLSGTKFEFYPGVDPTVYSNDTMPCDAGWVYDRSQYKSTILMTFDLVCSRSFYPDLAQSLFFAGAVFGVVVLGILADTFGRRPMLFFGVFCQFVLGVVIVFSPNIATYIVFRTLQGVVNDTVLSLAFVIGAEFVGPKRRVLAGMMVNCSAAVGVMSLAIVAAFARNWRGLQLFISVPSILAVLAIRVVPESARWLYSIGRHDEANAIIKKAATVNKVILPDGVFLMSESSDYRRESVPQTDPEEKDPQQPSVKDLFRYPNLRKNTFILMVVAFTNSLLYFGLTLDTGNWGDRDYLNFFTSGIVELLAYVFCIYALDKFGRKLTESGYLLLAGVACIVAELLPAGWWKTLVAMIGKFGAAGSIATTPVYIIELMPTPVRSVGAGLGWMAIEIGSIAAPLTFLASSYFWEPLSFFFFGGCALLAGLLTLLLPETRGLRLPETLEEGESLGSSTASGDSDEYGIATVSKKNNDMNLNAIVNQAYNGAEDVHDNNLERSNHNNGDIVSNNELTSIGTNSNTDLQMEGIENPVYQHDEEDEDNFRAQTAADIHDQD